jgi:hypothetical protein
MGKNQPKRGFQAVFQVKLLELEQFGDQKVPFSP